MKSTLSREETVIVNPLLLFKNSSRLLCKMHFLAITFKYFDYCVVHCTLYIIIH